MHPGCRLHCIQMPPPFPTGMPLGVEQHMGKLDTMNMLTAANLYMSTKIHEALEENTRAVHEEGGRITGAIDRNTGAVIQNTGAVSQAGEQISGAINSLHDTIKKRL